MLLISEELEFWLGHLMAKSKLLTLQEFTFENKERSYLLRTRLHNALQSCWSCYDPKVNWITVGLVRPYFLQLHFSHGLWAFTFLLIQHEWYLSIIRVYPHATTIPIFLPYILLRSSFLIKLFPFSRDLSSLSRFGRKPWWNDTFIAACSEFLENRQKPLFLKLSIWNLK